MENKKGRGVLLKARNRDVGACGCRQMFRKLAIEEGCRGRLLA